MKGVISIGSHYGQEYESWVMEGFENFMFFEPTKTSYDKLVKILPKLKNIKTFNIALGNYTGKANMFTETEHQGKGNSILVPKYHLEQYPDILFDSVEIVDIDKLDNIDYNRSMYDMLHIDTQGYELEVLKGAFNSLDYIRKIKTEVYRKELYEDCPMIEEVNKYLESKGFLLMSVIWNGITWGNAIFTKIKL